MEYRKTKEGEKFEKALAVVKARLEKQLRLNGKLKESQTIDINIKRQDHGIDREFPIDVSVWFGDKIIEIHYFHPNGKLRY